MSACQPLNGYAHAATAAGAGLEAAWHRVAVFEAVELLRLTLVDDLLLRLLHGSSPNAQMSRMRESRRRE